jgi:RND family efflux transporter MFP subunit
MKTKMRTPAWILLRAVGVLWLLAWALAACSSGTPEKPAGQQGGRLVRVIEVPEYSATRMRAFPALARATREVNLAFRVSGPLVSLPVNVGDYVEKGDLIAQIDRRDYEVRLQAAEAALETARAERELAQLQYTRHKNLLTSEAVSKARYDRVKADFAMLTAQADAAAQEVQAARNALHDTRLKAPFPGFVDNKFVESHDTVQAMQPIVLFLDCSVIEVTAGIPEDMLSQNITLKNFACGFETYPGLRFGATLKELGTKPMPSRQTYPLTVVLSRQDSARVKPGMAATVFVTFAAEHDVPVYVPVEAVVSDKTGEPYLWIFNPDSGRVNRRTVATGNISSSGIEILNNLKQGEWVVSAGAHFLSEDGQVQPIYPGKELL